ncbi:hypothetical protein CRUP_033030, partial [Coryphaenoides rupestris]
THQQGTTARERGGSGGGGSGPIRCQRCREVCKGEVVRVQDTHFHVKCFTCTVCNCDLARSGFFQKKGEYVCTADYQRLKPFPIGDRVTFSGKDCVCQQCSHTLVKSNEPIMIHGPSRKSNAILLNKQSS